MRGGPARRGQPLLRLAEHREVLHAPPERAQVLHRREVHAPVLRGEARAQDVEDRGRRAQRHRLRGRARLAGEHRGEGPNLGAHRVEPVERGVAASAGRLRRVIRAAHPVLKRRGLPREKHLALTPLQPERLLDGPPEQLQRRLGRRRVVQELKRILPVVGAPKRRGGGPRLPGELLRHGQGRRRVLRAVLAGERVPERGLAVLRVPDAHLGEARRDGARVVGGDGAVVDDESPRAFVLHVERTRLGHHHRELTHRALVELRQDMRHEIAVARDHQRLVVVAQADAERDQHGPQQVPVVQPRDGGAAHLERVDGRGGHAPLGAEARKEHAEALRFGKGGGRGGEPEEGQPEPPESARFRTRRANRAMGCPIPTFRASRDVPRRSQSQSWCPRPGQPCPSCLWWADATHR